MVLKQCVVRRPGNPQPYNGNPLHRFTATARLGLVNLEIKHSLTVVSRIKGFDFAASRSDLMDL